MVSFSRIWSGLSPVELEVAYHLHLAYNEIFYLMFPDIFIGSDLHAFDWIDACLRRGEPDCSLCSLPKSTF